MNTEHKGIIIDDIAVNTPITEKSTAVEYGAWDLIQLASEIKKSYQDLSEEFKEDLDDIARILSLKF